LIPHTFCGIQRYITGRREAIIDVSAHILDNLAQILV
jgi:hypothetical protein